MWMIGELLLLVVSQMCVLSAYVHILFHRAQPTLIFIQNHHTAHKNQQRTVCTRSIMVGKGGYLGKGSRNLEICRHGDHCIE